MAGGALGAGRVSAVAGAADFGAGGADWMGADAGAGVGDGVGGWGWGGVGSGAWGWGLGLRRGGFGRLGEAVLVVGVDGLDDGVAPIFFAAGSDEFVLG